MWIEVEMKKDIWIDHEIWLWVVRETLLFSLFLYIPYISRKAEDNKITNNLMS